MVEVRRIHPLEGRIDASILVPGSKSIANRALVCAALAVGASELTNVPDGDDTVTMLACLRELGLDAEASGDKVSITGTGPTWPPVPRTLHAGLAGTTSRFVTALAALGVGPTVIDGDPPLRARPFAPLHDALEQIGVAVEASEGPGRLPVLIQGPPASGAVAIRGDVSSQYVTALMMIGPYLPDGLWLELTTPLVSRPYVELTGAVMEWFGGPPMQIDDDEVRVEPGAYRPTSMAIEPDASSASYPLALAAVVGGAVEIPGLGADALQGDARFVDLLSAMGCEVTFAHGGVRVERHDAPLSGLDVDMTDISDLVPTFAVVAAVAQTPSRIRGVGFIRAKESDRLGDLAAELRSAGVDVVETDDGLDIRPSADRFRPARLATHHDHRLAMAFGVLGSCAPGIEVEHPDVVTKSWPGFWSMLDGLR